jgi:hypothetical protein
LIFSDIAIWADVVRSTTGPPRLRARLRRRAAARTSSTATSVLNYDTDLELFWSGNTTGEHLYEPLYFEADRAYGTFDHLIMEKALITTCAPLCGAHRDYEIKADKVHYKRDKSIVMHDVYLFLRDTKVGWVPVLAVPLPKRPRQPEEQRATFGRVIITTTTTATSLSSLHLLTRWVDEVSGTIG